MPIMRGILVAGLVAVLINGFPVAVGSGSEPPPDIPTSSPDPVWEAHKAVPQVPEGATSFPAGTEPTLSAALGCTSVSEQLNFRNFWTEESFDGLPLTAVIRQCSVPLPGESWRSNHVAYLYGTCDPGLEGGCGVPIEVQTWPVQDRNQTSFVPAEQQGFLAGEDTTIGGIPATWYEDRTRLELWRPDVTVVIFGDDSDRIELFALALVEAPSLLTELEGLGIHFNPDCLHDKRYCDGEPTG